MLTRSAARAVRSRAQSPRRRKNREPLTLEKLKAFISLLMMPLVGKPRIKDYWSSKALTSTPGLKSIMTRDEFLQIKKFIHFYDVENFNNADPYYRIRPLLDEILSNTKEIYRPPKNLTLDETMIPFKGRCKYIVYMPLKPVQYGFKAYTLTTAFLPLFFPYPSKYSYMLHLVNR